MNKKENHTNHSDGEEQVINFAPIINILSAIANILYSIKINPLPTGLLLLNLILSFISSQLIIFILFAPSNVVEKVKNETKINVKFYAAKCMYIVSLIYILQIIIRELIKGY